MSQSIPDQFIDTMAALRAIETNNADPMRHAVRSLRMEAEQVIANALRNAYSLAQQARSIQKDHADAVKEALEAAAKTEPKGSALQSQGAVGDGGAA